MAASQDGALDALGPFLAANGREAEFSDFVCDQSVRHPYHYAPYCTDPRSGWRQQIVQAEQVADFHRPQSIAPYLDALLAPNSDCRAGLASEIHRAWIVTADKLLLWDYEAASSAQRPSTDAGVDEVILSKLMPGIPSAANAVDVPTVGPLQTIAFVVPQADHVVQTAFGTTVKYYLVMAFANEIQVFAVAFDGDSIHGRMQVFGRDGALASTPHVAGPAVAPAATPVPPLFRLPTDGLYFTRIAGSQHGRIFLGGSDGCLHELVLRAPPSATVRVGLAGGAWVAVSEVAHDVAGWAKKKALDAIALQNKGEAKLVNHSAAMLSTLLSALLGSHPVHGYPCVDMAVDHERGLLAFLALDGRVDLWSLGPVGDELTPLSSVRDLDRACKEYVGQAGGDPACRPRPDLFQENRAKQCMKAQGDYAGSPLLDLQRVLAYPEFQPPATLPTAWPAVSVAFLPTRESRRVHLVVTAASGSRMYFTTYSEGQMRDAVNAANAAGGAGGGALMPSTTSSTASGAGAGSTSTTTSAPYTELRLLYVRMPPPAWLPRDVDMTAAGQRGDGCDPLGTGASTVPLKGMGVQHADLVTAGGRHSLMAVWGGPREWAVVGLSQDWLRRRSGPTGGLGGVPASRASYGESVSVVPLLAPPIALGPCMPEPGTTRDPVYAPSGAVLLPGGDTCPLPRRAWEVRLGQGIEGAVPLLPAQATSAGAGTKRGREGEANTATGAASAEPAHPGALVSQAGLTGAGTGVPDHAAHLIRRRLWDAPSSHGSASLALTLFSSQHDLAASTYAWDVLTTHGVRRLVHVRPVDQVASILAQMGAGQGQGAGAAGSATAAWSNLVASVAMPEELFSMVAGVACRGPYEGGAPSSQAGAAGAGLGGAAAVRPATLVYSITSPYLDTARSNALDLLKLAGKPHWRPGTVGYSKHDLVFSPAMGGLLWYCARLLGPLWDTQLFMQPPADGQHGHRGDVVRLGAKRVGLSGTSASSPAPAHGVRAVHLPRLTTAECAALAKRLAAVCAHMRRMYPIVSGIGSSTDSGDAASRLREGARKVGMEAEFGLEPSTQGGDAAAASRLLQSGAQTQRSAPMDTQTAGQRAYTIEALYAWLVYKLVERACEAAWLMGAVADPLYGAVEVLIQAQREVSAAKASARSPTAPAAAAAAPATNGGATPPAPAPAPAPYSTSSTLLLDTAGTLTWAGLVTSPAAVQWVDGLFSRMMEAARTRAKAPALPSVRGPAPSQGAQAQPGAQAQQGGLGTSRAFGLAGSRVAGLGLGLGFQALSGAAATDVAESLSTYLRTHAPSFYSEGSRLKAGATALAEKASRAISSSERAALLSQSYDQAVLAVRSWASASSSLGPRSLLAHLPDLCLLCQAWRRVEGHSYVIKLMAETAQAIAGGAQAVLSLPDDAPAGPLGEAGGASAMLLLSDSTEGRVKAYMYIIQALAAVQEGTELASMDGTPGPWRSLLNEALQWQDALLHDSVYRWLQAGSGQEGQEVLLSLETRWIEGFMKARSTHPALIVGYYVSKGRYGAAAQLYRGWAERQTLSSLYRAAGAAMEGSPDQAVLADATRIQAREGYLKKALELGEQSVQRMQGSMMLSASRVGGGGGAGAQGGEAVTPSDLLAWERMHRTSKAQLLLLAGLQQLAGSDSPSADFTSPLGRDLLLAEYDLLSLADIADRADRYRMLDVAIACLDVERSPSSYATLCGHYTAILTALVRAVGAQIPLRELPLATGQIEVACAMGLGATGLGMVPGAYGTAQGLLEALKALLRTLATKFHPDPHSPAWAFPTAMLVASLEEKQAEDGWLAAAQQEGGAGAREGWLAVEALRDVGWAERHQVYRRCMANLTGRPAMLSALARAWCALIRAWAEAGEMEGDARRQLAAAAGDIASAADSAREQVPGDAQLRAQLQQAGALAGAIAASVSQLGGGGLGASLSHSAFHGLAAASGLGLGATRRPQLLAASGGRIGVGFGAGY